VRRRITTVAVAAAASALALTSVFATGATAATKPAASSTIRIGLLLPESATTRYEAFDHPVFKKELAKKCPKCVLDYANASQNESTQLTQFQALVAKGDKVIVLDPVNGATASTMVALAAKHKIKVISYDRLVTGTKGLSLYISFDNYKVGVLQATALVARLHAIGKKSGKLVVINGSTTDNNAHLFNAGAMSVLSKSGFTIAAQHWTKNWDPADAQTWMSSEIAALGGPSGFVGVYAANDGTAGGAIAAMNAANFSSIPPITGQDAQLDAIQRIILGTQYMTVYKALIPEATSAADAAFALASGKKLSTKATVANGSTKVPSILLTPIAVTKSKIASTVVKDKFYSAKQICDSTVNSSLPADCTALGIK